MYIILFIYENLHVGCLGKFKKTYGSKVYSQTKISGLKISFIENTFGKTFFFSKYLHGVGKFFEQVKIHVSKFM